MIEICSGETLSEIKVYLIQILSGCPPVTSEAVGQIKKKIDDSSYRDVRILKS